MPTKKKLWQGPLETSVGPAGDWSLVEAGGGDQVLDVFGPDGERRAKATAAVLNTHPEVVAALNNLLEATKAAAWPQARQARARAKTVLKKLEVR